MDPIKAAQALLADLKDMKFEQPVEYVYNPLEYGWQSYSDYLRRYGMQRKEVVLLGMNPGPWGMVQTGVPFGEVSIVRDWLKIKPHHGKPKQECDKRPVQGYDCPRSEVSGRRLWGWARDRFGTPERFFERFLILNYCPLAFMEQGGRNRTPDKLPASEKEPLLAACNKHLQCVLDFYQPRLAVGVGKFAQQRIQSIVSNLSFEPSVGSILHPSPASPAANRGWVQQAEAQLEAMGVQL